jgi:hypothetical protein
MTNSITTRINNVERNSWKTISYVLGMIVYGGGIFYAEARAFALFTRNLDAELIPMAIVGVVALGITAIAAPLAYHFGTAPGLQRKFLVGFYAFDIVAMGANAILDAAMHSSDVTSILELWRVYVLPALPLVCLAGWAIYFMIDPSHKRRDKLKTAMEAAEDEMADRMVDGMKSADITAIIQQAANSRANEIAQAITGLAIEKVQGEVNPSARQSVTVVEVAPTTTPKVKPSLNGKGH